MDNETVTIPLSEYKKLKRRDRILTLLEAGGVDNWEWYGESLESLEDDDD